MINETAIQKAIRKFQDKYKSLTSGDLQTFVIAGRMVLDEISESPASPCPPQGAEEILGKLSQIESELNLSIPYYAYGDNEAACSMAMAINQAREMINQLQQEYASLNGQDEEIFQFKKMNEMLDKEYPEINKDDASGYRGIREMERFAFIKGWQGKHEYAPILRLKQESNGDQLWRELCDNYDTSDAKSYGYATIIKKLKSLYHITKKKVR